MRVSWHTRKPTFSCLMEVTFNWARHLNFSCSECRAIFVVSGDISGWYFVSGFRREQVSVRSASPAWDVFCTLFLVTLNHLYMRKWVTYPWVHCNRMLFTCFLCIQTPNWNFYSAYWNPCWHFKMSKAWTWSRELLPV